MARAHGAALLEGYAEGGPTGRFRWTPDQQANLDALAARYVDALERGGYWVEPKDYEAALAEYEARVAYEDQQRELAGSGGGS